MTENFGYESSDIKRFTRALRAADCDQTANEANKMRRREVGTL